jgi:EAL domain-containing protein (putative c-di-GMP-specific phosphodiesterase class I)
VIERYLVSSKRDPQGGLASGTLPPRAHTLSADMPLEELEGSFERALAMLHMAFQPIVDAKTAELFGYEALMRADDPVLMNPGLLLDAAERLHRVERLGRIVRRQVAQSFGGEPDSSGAVFVNLHALDLLDKSLASPYSPLCKLRERVVLEITERASVAAIDDIRYRLAALREMGYRIAIDDLGAGHDRMQQFTFLDADFVKLDMSLVRDIDRHEDKRRMVGRILDMCRDQGIRVIGEGIETVGERDTLAELGCELLQGFLIARPTRAVTPPKP